VASSKGSNTRPRINEAARAEVLGRGTLDVPTTRVCLNLAKRLESHGESYFGFITTPRIEPTNYLAEQAIRFVVTDRWITRETRSERGDRWCERTWKVDGDREVSRSTAVASVPLAAQGRSCAGGRAGRRPLPQWPMRSRR
jgi:hypothetical protein